MKKKLIILSSVAALVIAGIVLLFTTKKDNFEIPLIEKIFQPKAEFIPNQKIDITTTEAYRLKDSIYDDFRSSFRMHFQTIGLASFADSSRLLLLSEPAPYFDSDTIRSICAKFTHHVEAKTHKIGFDGHVTDIVILLANATTENVGHLVDSLSKALYLSDYKANTTPLPVQRPRAYFVDDNIDYQITLYEFNDWFMEQDEQFIQLKDTGKSVTVEQIFADKLTGVYFSKVPGFVAWAIAKKSDLSEQLTHIRQFTLDADLILGALADSATLVVIGRERQSALYELPPLNVESILLLASVTEKELSQSLDVNDFMAGKMVSGSDWCPTYLSKELENTEFGHLLTITDVLLKDWSENGTIQEAYYKYPSPPRFPFDRPLFRKLGLNELVYNWNTWNAMYAIDMDEGFTIYTLNRTGSLPVFYFNSPERSVSIGRRYENQAYNYFATLGNTDLARVVQYTALYQLFMDNGITYFGDTHPAYPANKPYLLQKPTKDLLNYFKNLSDKQIDLLADTIASKNFTAFQKDHVNKQLRQNEQRYNFKYTEEQTANIHKDVAKNARNGLRNDIANIRSLLKSLSEEEFNFLAKYLSYPRGMQANHTATYKVMQQARRVNNLMRTIGKNNLGIIGLDLKNVRNYYVNSLAGSSARYLKTPSVIVTYNDMLTTGGHNLSSGITRVKSLTGYKSGGGRPTYAQANPAPSGSAPKPTSSGTPSAAKPSSGKSGGTTAKPSSSGGSKPASQPRAVQNIRPRGEVISTAPRTQRGF